MTTSHPKRGVLFVVWGNIETQLNRSIASVKAVHPELPIKVERILHPQSLAAKASMGSLSPFESTLYLDADTIVLGNLDYAFEKAEQFGLACCICEAPWMRRYGAEHGDRIEYNTGVLFFTQKAVAVFSEWSRTAPDFASKSTWTMIDGVPRGLAYDDQASFSNAVEVAEMNPFILPLNYNLRPFFHRQFFAPVKIWHSYDDVPARLREISDACDRNERPVTFVDLASLETAPPVAAAQVTHTEWGERKNQPHSYVNGLVSIITPTNSTRWLKEAYESIKAQSYEHWEWILVANGDVHKTELEEMFGDDARVVCADFPDLNTKSIGALKRMACGLAKGEIYCELDHDDLLLSNALACVKEAFDANPDVGMVYSNRAAVNEDGSAYYFGQNYGWEYRDSEADGQQLVETVMPGVHPANFSRIWYAPDHLRAWRASEYWKIGGHDPALEVADDHDLSCRFYLGSEVLHLDACLYIYRVHGENNWLKNVDRITNTMWSNYDLYVLKMYERWCAEQELAVDVLEADTADSRADNSVGLLRSSALASRTDVVTAMNEAYRSLAHGGLFAIEVPSTDGRAAFQDPTHKSFFNENSFHYWTRGDFQKFIAPAGAFARFQVLRLRTYFPSDWHKANDMAYVQAHLVAVKEGPRIHGELLI